MRWISTIGGVIATGAALLVLVSLPSESVPAESASAETVEPPIAVLAEVEQIGEPINGEQLPEPDLDVAGLGRGIANVLADSGYTQFVGSGELMEKLPDDVVQVLMNEEAVLVIPSQEETE